MNQYFEIFIKGLFRLNRAFAYHDAFIARLPQPTVVRPDSDEEGDEFGLKKQSHILTQERKPGSPASRDVYLKHLNLLYDDDSEDEGPMSLGNLQLKPLTKKSKAGYVSRTYRRESVRREMDVIESEYGRRSPELYVSVSLSENAILKAQAKIDRKKTTLMLKNGQSGSMTGADTSKYAVLVSPNSNFEPKNDMNGDKIGGKSEDNILQDDGYLDAQTRDPLLFYEEKKSIDQKMEVAIKKSQHESKETDIILQSDKDWFAKR